MPKQCIFLLGNQPAEGGGNFTLQSGITPSTAMLRFTLNQPLSQVMDMTLTTLQETRVFRNCRVSRTTVSQGEGGRWREATVLDRRWLWADGHFAVYGEYNTVWYSIAYRSHQLIERTPRELASILLEALGETGYDVTALPQIELDHNGDPVRASGPAVVWDAANPAAELQKLAEMYGCIVTLSTDDRVVLYRDGYGQTPRADSRQMDFTTALEAPVIPKVLVAEGGQTTVYHDMNLEPIALWNGEWISVYNLPYLSKVSTGLASLDPNTFLHPNLNASDINHAKRYIWRYYRIAPTQLPVPKSSVQNKTNGNRLTVNQQAQRKSYFNITAGNIWRVLPTISQQPDVEVNGTWYLANTTNANAGGFQFYNPVKNALNDDNWILPVHLGQIPGITGVAPHGNAPGEFMTYADPFLYDHHEGVITFQTPTYFRELGATYPAIIKLRVKMPIRDPNTRATLCQQFWQAPQSPIAVNIPKIIKNSGYWYEYSIHHDNEPGFIANSLSYLARELNSYVIGTGYSAPYKGFIFDIPVDGVVRAVVYDVAENGPGTTHIDYNMERPEAYFTLAEARNRRLVTYDQWLQREFAYKKARGIV